MQPAEVAAYWEANAETWTRLARAGCDVYRDRLNTPLFLEMLPAVSGLRGLDIGCGEGSNTRQLARLGARMCAIDLAPTFIRNAQEMETDIPLGIEYLLCDCMRLSFHDNSFEFATAFMSLMDMPDQALALKQVARVLRPGAFFQFSILHPCFAPPHRKVLREPDGSTRAIEVARYFDRTDGEVETWWFSTLPPDERERTPPFQIPVFHRTLSDWVEMISSAGLVIEKMGEPSASPELAAAQPILADTRVAPLFLHIRARKPAPYSSGN
jgi:2-polyprenyl-3-methyl-5-hydroxy-6-metoxy-1,4-benzoquinol methylase